MNEISFELPEMDERGVSPVIGVILMVAITVILAAVIASAVLGFGDNVNSSVNAGVTVDGDNTASATVTLSDKGTADKVKIVSQDGTDASAASGSLPLSSVGASATLNSSTPGEGDYNVVAVGPNGAESVVRSVTVTS